jgi:hypothetical protein
MSDKTLTKQFRQEINRKVTRKFPRRRVVSGGFLNILTADLVEMEEVDGFRYILSVIELYSRKAWGFPLKNKKTTTVVSKFKELFKELPENPSYLWTDLGKEFVGKPMKDFLKQHGMEQYSTFSENKSVIAERYNRTMKLWMDNDDENWVNALPRLVEEYNSKKHSTTKQTPNDVFNGEAIPESKPFVGGKDFKDKPKFEVGDTVRLSRVKGVFEKQVNNWTKRVFTVSEVKNTNPITYKVDDIVDGTVIGSFYAEELQKTTMDFFLVKEVLKRRTRNGKKEIQVVWLGYEDLIPEWIPESSLQDFQKK